MCTVECVRVDKPPYTRDKCHSIIECIAFKPKVNFLCCDAASSKSTLEWIKGVITPDFAPCRAVPHLFSFHSRRRVLLCDAMQHRAALWEQSWKIFQLLLGCLCKQPVTAFHLTTRDMQNGLLGSVSLFITVTFQKFILIHLMLMKAIRRILRILNYKAVVIAYLIKIKHCSNISLIQISRS